MLLGLPGHSKGPIRYPPLTGTISNKESKSRERLRVAHGPCIACLGELPWRHTNRKRDHNHHPNANDRSGAVHDHGVAQVGHRKGFLFGSILNADTIARLGGLCQCLRIRL